MRDTSWNKVGKWYDSIVGDEGSYYHQKIILPNVVKLLALKKDSSLLDLGCGQGVLAGQVPKEVDYLGLDAAKSLLKMAKDRHKDKTFLYADITKPLPIQSDRKFSHAAIILALQNMQDPENVLKNVSNHLISGATLVIILNHPCFRIPRQSSWAIDEKAKLQYRRVNSYMSEQKIPIVTSPGKSQSETTWSFHYPLSSYFSFLQNAGFVVQDLQEWCSDKESLGKAARWENRARKEFPLFMAIKAMHV